MTGASQSLATDFMAKNDRNSIVQSWTRATSSHPLPYPRSPSCDSLPPPSPESEGFREKAIAGLIGGYAKGIPPKPPTSSGGYLTNFSDNIGRTPTPSVGPSNATAPFTSIS